MRGSFAAAAGLGLILLLSSGARAAPPAEGAPAPPAAPPAPEADLDVTGVEAPPFAPGQQVTAKDRILFNAALDALVMGDFRQARNLFALIAREGQTPEARTTAAVITDRIDGLEQRRGAGLLPPLRPPVVGDVTAVRPRPAPRPTSARAPVVAISTVFGLALWGWTLPTFLGIDSGESSRAFIGLYMLTATSSFVAPYLLTRSRAPSPAQANLVFYGGTRGAEFGLLLSNLLFGRAGGDTSGNERAMASSLLLGSLMGTAAGVFVPPALSLSPGDVRTMAVMGDYGLFVGFALARVFQFDQLGDSPPPPPNFFGSPDQLATPEARDERARATSAAGLIGAGLGLVGGRLLSLRRNNTWGDGEVMRGAGLLGVLAGATLASAMSLDDDDDHLLVTLAAGGTVGLVGGDLFVHNTSFTPSEALMVDLALLAGGLGGAGLTYLFTDTSESTPYLLSATLGAAASGGIVAWALSRRRPDEGEALATGPRVALLPRFGDQGPNGLQLVGSF